LKKKSIVPVSREMGPDGKERFSQCFMFASLLNHTPVPCSGGWDYDRTDYDRTIPTEFNWVCEKSFYVTEIATAKIAGSAIGTILFGWAGDR